MDCQRPTIKNYLPGFLLVIQCALLHPTFAHSRLARLIRIGLTPINFLWSITLPFRCATRLPEDAEFGIKMAIAGMAIHMAVRSLEWGFASGSYYTRTLKTVDGVQRWEKVRELDVSFKKAQEDEPCDLFSLSMWTLLHLSSQRGLQFTWGAPGVANIQSISSLFARLFWVNIPLTVAFVFLVMTRDSPGGTPTSALSSIGVPSFPGMKILSEALYSVFFGISIASSMDLAFTLMTLVVTLVYRLGNWLHWPDVFLQLFDPKYYPPIYQSPHKSSSIQEFWGRGWHTLAQRSFLIMGGKPMVWVTKRMGASPQAQRLAGFFAIFAASGIYHEYGVFAVTHSSQPHHHLLNEFPGTLFYFMLQPLGILIEPYVIPLIPKKLGGGRLWFWTFSILVSYPFRNRYLSNPQLLRNVPPISEWSWMYTISHFEL